MDKFKSSSVSIPNGTAARKSFHANLLQIEFNVTITDADIGSLKSLHTFFGKYLDHMLVKFKIKSYGRKYTTFGAFWQ